MAYSLTSVIKGVSLYSIGQILTKAAGFLLIPLYTRFLTPQDYGIIGYLEVYLALMTTFLMLGFYGAQTRLYYDCKENIKKVGELLFSLNAFMFLLLLVICSILSLFGSPLFDRLINNRDITFSPLILLIIWTAFFQIFNQMVISFYMAAKEYKTTAILQLLQFLISTLLIIYFVVSQKQGALGKFKGAFFAQSLFFIVFYLNYIRKFRFHFSTHQVKKALSFGLPIVVHLICSNCLLLIDRLILERFVSLSDLGIYTLAYQVGLGMSVLVASINKAWTPNYYDLMNQENMDHGYHVRKAFGFWLTVIGLICMVGGLWSHEIINLLTPEKFHESAKIVPIILMSYVFEGLYFFAVNPIFYYRRTLVLPFFTGAAVLMNIGMNLLFIPWFGIYGAAYATLISYAALAILVYLFSRRLFNPRYELIKIFFLIILLSSCLWPGFQQNSLIVELIKVAFVGAYLFLSFVLFQDYFRPIIKNLKEELNSARTLSKFLI